MRLTIALSSFVLGPRQPALLVTAGKQPEYRDENDAGSRSMQAIAEPRRLDV